MSDAREQADQAADRLRDGLLTTLKELDRRRQRATDLRYQVQQHRTALVLTAGGVVAVVGSLVALAQVRGRRRYHHRFQRRWEGLRRAWEHPDRVATQADEAPFLGQLMKKLVLAVGVAFGTQLIKRSAVKLVPAKTRHPSEPYVS